MIRAEFHHVFLLIPLGAAHPMPLGLPLLIGRIAIARGLLRPGSILLLDEFSSSLDPDTEDRLMRGLIAGQEDKTMIFITHRQKISEFCKTKLSLER